MKSMDKNPNNSHNYHDENHDEMELYQVDRKKSTQWHSTPEQRTAQNQSHRLWWAAAYLYPYYDIDNPELYNWNENLKPNRKYNSVT